MPVSKLTAAEPITYRIAILTCWILMGGGTALLLWQTLFHRMTPGMRPWELVACLILGVSIVQTVIEVAIALPIIGAVNWRLLWTWWAGVIIVYGVCALTLFLTGQTLGLFASDVLHYNQYHDRAWISGGLTFATSWAAWRSLWHIWLILWIEAFLVQWAVIRFGTRTHKTPPRWKRVALASLLAKTVTSILWTFGPIDIVQI